jgi:F0F1-type ATP synthase assembly protein I
MLEGPPNAKELGFYLSLAQIGMEMVFPTVVGIGLDYYFNWTPRATIVGFVIGFVGGFIHLLMLVKQHDKAEKSKPGGDSK